MHRSTFELMSTSNPWNNPAVERSLAMSVLQSRAIFFLSSSGATSSWSCSDGGARAVLLSCPGDRQPSCCSWMDHTQYRWGLHWKGDGPSRSCEQTSPNQTCHAALSLPRSRSLTVWRWLVGECCEYVGSTTGVLPTSMNWRMRMLPCRLLDRDMIRRRHSCRKDLKWLARG